MLIRILLASAVVAASLCLPAAGAAKTLTYGVTLEGVYKWEGDVDRGAPTRGCGIRDKTHAEYRAKFEPINVQGVEHESTVKVVVKNGKVTIPNKESIDVDVIERYTSATTYTRPADAPEHCGETQTLDNPPCTRQFDAEIEMLENTKVTSRTFKDDVFSKAPGKLTLGTGNDYSSGSCWRKADPFANGMKFRQFLQSSTGSGLAKLATLAPGRKTVLQGENDGGEYGQTCSGLGSASYDDCSGFEVDGTWTTDWSVEWAAIWERRKR